MTDELALAGAVLNGRASATRAIAHVLDGSWPTGDPLNTDAATLLVSTFYALESEARSLFRESLCVLLDEYATGAIHWSLEELGSTMYVSRKIALSRRFPHELREIMLRALETATKRSDVASEGLLLKYLASEGLITRLDTWRAFYSDRKRHAYTCFMGMAAINLESAILWSLDVATDTDKDLILYHGLPSVVRAHGGAQYVQRALRFLMSREDGRTFEPFAASYARTLTEDLASQQVLVDALSSTHDSVSPPIAPVIVNTDSAIEPEIADLATQWDRRIGPDSMPSRIQDILAGRYDDEAA